jgi:hypothetical protein
MSEPKESPDLETMNKPARYFRIALQGDRSSRRWELTESQLRALIDLAEGRSLVNSRRAAGNRALNILRAIDRYTAGEDSLDEKVEMRARLSGIAADLDSYARDEGGLSEETRQEIRDDAEFLRTVANV